MRWLIIAHLHRDAATPEYTIDFTQDKDILNAVGVHVFVVDTGVNALHQEFACVSLSADALITSLAANSFVSAVCVLLYIAPRSKSASLICYVYCLIDLSSCSGANIGGQFDGINNVEVTPGSNNDGHGHGTHVAGTILGATTGMARGATLWDVKVTIDLFVCDGDPCSFALNIFIVKRTVPLLTCWKDSMPRAICSAVDPENNTFYMRNVHCCC